MTVDDDLRALFTSHRRTFLLRAALRVGLPEALGDDTRTVTGLAERADCHAPTLRRVLRALAALGLVVESPADAFRLTGRGRLLRPDVEGSVRELAAFELDDSMWDAWPALDHALRTGEQAFAHVHGTDYMSAVGWDEHSELRVAVDHWMRRETRTTAPALLAAYDLGRFTTVVDVGGGSGPLLAAVLAAHPHQRGVLLDRDDGVGLAPATLAEAGVADRCVIECGDFFVSVPRAELYLCKSVLFNHADDTRVAELLAAVGRAIAPDGRFLLLEQVLPEVVDGSVPAEVYLDDVDSVVSLGGRWRTEPEYRTLLDAAGFTMTVHPLPGAPAGYRLIEAAPR